MFGFVFHFLHEEGPLLYVFMQQTMFLIFRFAFQHNPPLQARAVIVYGCVCKEIDDSRIRQLLLVFIKVRENGSGKCLSYPLHKM